MIIMAMQFTVQDCLASEIEQATFKLFQYFKSKIKKKSSKMRKELNHGSSFPVWRFYHERRVSVIIRPAFRVNQASTGCVKCSIHPNQTPGMEPPPTHPEKGYCHGS